MNHLAQAHHLHQTLTVVDAHHDVLMDVLARHKRGETGSLSGEWAPQFAAGGVNVQVLPIFVDHRYLPGLGLRECLRMLEAALADIDHDNRHIELATTAHAIDAIVERGKIAGILALEGCDALAGDPTLLRLLYRLGVRMVGLTWEQRNAFADGTGEKNPGGLTNAGRQAVQEMAAHDVLLDVSHLAEPGFWEALDLAETPVIASHSNARAVCDHPRNLTDDQIKALAGTGGVIGLNFVGLFIDPAQMTADRLVDHLAHIANLVGIAHVGLGPDFLEGPLRDLSRQALVGTNFDPAMVDTFWIPDCQRSPQLPFFTAKLLERGFSQDDIAAVLGGNWLRVFRQVWR